MHELLFLDVLMTHKDIFYWQIVKKINKFVPTLFSVYCNIVLIAFLHLYVNAVRLLSG